MGKKIEDSTYMGMGALSPREQVGTQTTIVGGQPSGEHREQMIQVPVGLEQILLVAATDPVFEQELCEDRNTAVKKRGFNLTESEQAVLQGIPESQLKGMIRRIDTSEANLERRGFMKSVAATLVSLTAGSAVVSSCARKPSQKEPAHVQIPPPAGPATEGIRADEDETWEEAESETEDEPEKSQVTVETPPKATRGSRP